MPNRMMRYADTWIAAITAGVALLSTAPVVAAQTGRAGAPTRASIDVERSIAVQLRADRTADVRIAGRNLDRELTRPQVLHRGRPLRGVTVQLGRGERGSLEVSFVTRPGVAVPLGEPLELVFYDQDTALRVPIVFQPAPAPDLVVVHAEFSTTNPGSRAEPDGEITTQTRVRMRVTIRNIGAAPAVLGDDGTLFWVQNPTSSRHHARPSCAQEILPGEDCLGMVTLIEPGDLPAGTHPLTIEVDPSDRVAESREDNHEEDLDLVIDSPPAAAGPPNLRIQAVDVAGNEAAVTVVNSGGGDIYLEANIEIVSASQHFAPARMIGGVWLQPGETHTAVLDRVPGCATDEQSVTFTVDPENRLDEKIETDNQSTVDASLVAAAKPDLVIADVLFTQDPPLVAGTPITTAHRVMIEVRVENTGLGPACLAGPLWHAAETPLSGELDGTTGLEQLAPGEDVRSWAFLLEPGQLAAGTYDLRIVVDPGGTVPETNELNNTFKARLVISPAGNASMRKR